jgi:sugar phosphate isomerase/epimerase
MTRREFVRDIALLSTATAVLATSEVATAAQMGQRKMTMDLVCGAIGVSANQTEAIELAARHGFESVGVDGGYVAGLSQEQMAELKQLLASKKLVFGAAGLPVEFRRDQATFEKSLKGLETVAAGLNRAGVDRIGTWISPSSGSLPYVQNFRQHAVRLREAAKVLKDSGLRLGLEYVGPKTAWASNRYPFIHTLAEVRELIEEIGTGNVGVVLDSWHWWNAGDSGADILALSGRDVIAVDLNDAPSGIPREQQVDNRRELPCATGVIDVGAFLNALNRIGYDGPVRVEPFNQALNNLENDEACAAAAASLKKAFDLIQT